MQGDLFTMNEVITNTVEAISRGRTDIILSMIETYGKEIYEEGLKDSLSLKSLLDSNSTESGTFLHLATQLNQTDIVRTLMLAGSDPSLKNEQNQTCFDYAQTTEMQTVYLHELMRVIALSCVPKVARLLGSGLDVNSQKLIITRDSPLHWAATYADYNTVCFLLDKGANPNALNCYGATPFHDAQIRGEPEIIEELLRHGANPNIKPKSGKYQIKNYLLNDSESVSFQMPDDESDLERVSDSTSSWVNAGGSHDSLTVACPPEILQPIELTDEYKSDAILMNSSELDLLSPNTTESSNFIESSIYSAGDLKEKCKLLWPKPKKLQLINNEEFALPKELSIYFVESSSKRVGGEILGVWETHSNLLSKLGLSFQFMGSCLPNHLPSGGGNVICHINEEMFGGSSESFTLHAQSSGTKLVASDISGFFYAVVFFIKFVQLFEGNLMIPSIKVSDWPTLKLRSWVIDVSSTNPTLSLDSIRREVDLASLFRFNYLFLRLTVTNSMKGGYDCHFTPQDIINLEKYCIKRCVTLAPFIDLCSPSNQVGKTFVGHPIVNYLRNFSNRKYLYVGPTLARFIFCEENLDINFLFGESCLIIDTCLLDPTFSWLNRIPLNSILVSSFKHFGDYSNSYLIQRRLSQTGSVMNLSVPSVLENSLTGCCNLLFSSLHDATKANQSIENVAFVMLETTRQSKYYLLRTFYLPAMVFGGGIAWNSHFKIENIETVIAKILDYYMFDDNHKFGEVVLDFCQLESILNNIPHSSIVSITYELVSHPDNVILDHLTAEKIQRAVRGVKKSLAKLTPGNAKDHFSRIALEEIQLVSELLLFSLRLCRHLLNAGQNPNSKNNASTGLAVINVGLSNLPPPIKTDLANKLLELMRRFRKVNLQTRLSRGLEQEGQPFYSIFQQLVVNDLANDILEV